MFTANNDGQTVSVHVPGTAHSGNSEMFGRLVDLERFHTVLEAFEMDIENGAIKAIGWLAIFNPSFPDRYFMLDLSVYEDRQMAQILVYLAVAEDGENWQDEHYWRFRLGQLEDEPFPGWELQLSWVEENDDPAQANTKGIVCSLGAYVCNITLGLTKSVCRIGMPALICKSVVW